MGHGPQAVHRPLLIKMNFNPYFSLVAGDKADNCQRLPVYRQQLQMVIKQTKRAMPQLTVVC